MLNLVAGGEQGSAIVCHCLDGACAAAIDGGAVTAKVEQRSGDAWSSGKAERATTEKVTKRCGHKADYAGNGEPRISCGKGSTVSASAAATRRMAAATSGRRAMRSEGMPTAGKPKVIVAGANATSPLISARPTVVSVVRTAMREFRSPSISGKVAAVSAKRD